MNSTAPAASVGPALDSVATRLTEDQIVRQVLQGGGNMPAYGNALNPSETKALVSFLMTLRGNDLQPAIDASRELTRNSENETKKAQDAAWDRKALQFRNRSNSLCPIRCGTSSRIGSCRFG